PSGLLVRGGARAGRALDCSDQGSSHYNRSQDGCRDPASGRLRPARGRDPDGRPRAARVGGGHGATRGASHRGHSTGGHDGRSFAWKSESVSRLFGTDGIRGVANEAPLTPDLAYRVGRELAATLAAQHGGRGARVVIGRDTRRSGPLLEAAMVAGLLSAGADCYTIGVLPTPGIALLTRALDAD